MERTPKVQIATTRTAIAFYVGSLVMICSFSIKAQEVCKPHVDATTLNTKNVVTQTGTWVFSGLSLVVTKLSNESDLFYVTQVTFQFSAPAPETGIYAAQFQMRVKDSTNTYIMPPMETGGVTTVTDAYNNAVLSDTVYDQLNGKEPPAGTYTFELWELAGVPNLLVVPYMSNIAVQEVPRANCAN